MNADEILSRLREYAKRCDGIHNCWNAPTLTAAADLIESLQGQLKETWEWDMYQCANREIERLRKKLELVQLDRDTAHEEMNRLKAELSASQARERAAVCKERVTKDELRGMDGEPATNADRIRAMSDEELADFLVGLAEDGNLRIRDWLRQPATK